MMLRKYFPDNGDVTIPDTESNRGELEKQRLPISTDIPTIEKKGLRFNECITCGSHSFIDLGDKLKCEYCGNEY